MWIHAFPIDRDTRAHQGMFRGSTRIVNIFFASPSNHHWNLSADDFLSIDSHERYWKKIHPEAIDFIKALIKPNPADRPTAEQALKHKVSLYVVCNFESDGWFSAAISSGSLIIQQERNTISQQVFEKIGTFQLVLPFVPAINHFSHPWSLRNSRQRWKSTVSSLIAVSRLAKAGAAASARSRANSGLSPVEVSEDEGFHTAEEEGESKIGKEEGLEKKLDGLALK